MLRIPAIAAALLSCVCAADAQQPASANHGPAYPSESQRGPAFPKSVAPTQSNPTNWDRPPPSAEPVPIPRWLRRAERRYRFR